MTDAERVLHALLHDLRTPLGVAQGYLRLIKDGHLKDPEERDRAIAKALHALGQTGRLCENAGEFLESADAAPDTAHISAESFVNQVEASARSQGWMVAPATVGTGDTVAVTGNLAAVCDAILTIVAPASHSRGSDPASNTIHMRADNRELKFAAASGREPDLESPAAVPFDRCWSRGLPVAVACRRIVRSSGQILTLGADQGLIVAFPLESGSL